MTEAATPIEVEGPHKPLFVWWSTEESVRDGIISALACIEVLVAVVAYWAIAIYFETFTHLWVSICIAPLLLLRSDQSAALGASWFDRYISTMPKFVGEHQTATLVGQFWLGSIAALAIAAVTAYLAATYLVVEYESWGVFWRSLVIGFIAINLGFSGAVLAVGLIAGAAAYTRASLVILLLSSSMIGLQGGLSGLIGGAAGAGAAVLFIRSEALGDFSIAPAGCLGLWIRSLITRFAATACYLRVGFWAIPENFVNTLFIVDLFHPAELVPGHQLFKSDSIMSEYASSPKLADRALFTTIFIFLFIPAYAYRLSINSTCWLYLPLIYVSSKINFSFSHAHLLDLLARSPLERLRRWLAIGTAMGFALTLLAFNFMKLPELVATKLVSPFEYFFLLDFPWKKPWQMFNLLSAAITIYTWFKIGALRIDIEHVLEEKATVSVNEKIEWLKFWLRVRNVSSVILILILAVHALLAFNAFNVQGWLPRYIWRGLSSFYGEYIPPPPH